MAMASIKSKDVASDNGDDCDDVRDEVVDKLVQQFSEVRITKMSITMNKEIKYADGLYPNKIVYPLTQYGKDISKTYTLSVNFDQVLHASHDLLFNNEMFRSYFTRAGIKIKGFNLRNYTVTLNKINKPQYFIFTSVNPKVESCWNVVKALNIDRKWNPVFDRTRSNYGSIVFVIELEKFKQELEKLTNCEPLKFNLLGTIKYESELSYQYLVTAVDTDLETLEKVNSERKKAKLFSQLVFAERVGEKNRWNIVYDYVTKRNHYDHLEFVFHLPDVDHVVLDSQVVKIRFVNRFVTDNKWPYKRDRYCIKCFSESEERQKDCKKYNTREEAIKRFAELAADNSDIVPDNLQDYFAENADWLEYKKHTT